MAALDRRQPSVRSPKQGRSRATVAAIIEAATRILAEQGWRGFNTNAVAARAGVSIGSLYEYFRDKTGLVEAIVSEHLADAEMKWSSILVRRADSAEALIDAVVEGLVALHRSNPRLHHVLTSEVPLTPDMRLRADMLRREAIASVQDRLRGIVRNPGVTAQLLIDTADTVVHRWFVEDDGSFAPPDRMTQELQRMLRAYLAVAMQPD